MEKRTYSVRQLIAIRHKTAAKKAAQAQAEVPVVEEKKTLTPRQIGAIIAKRKAKAAALAA